MSFNFAVMSNPQSQPQGQWNPQSQPQSQQWNPQQAHPQPQGQGQQWQPQSQPQPQPQGQGQQWNPQQAQPQPQAPVPMNVSTNSWNVTSSTPVETKTGLEILGDSIVEIFDKYVKFQCLPHLVEGLQKEGFQITVEKMENLLPQKSTIARSSLLSGGSGPSSLPSFGAPSFAGPSTSNVVGAPQMFNPQQGGAFNPGGFMPQNSGSTADKKDQEKLKLRDPNFNDNFIRGCCLSYPTRGNEGKYRFCGNPVSNQYTIVCEKCRSSRSAARELDSDFTQKLMRHEQFDFDGYRRNVAQKRLDYANGTKSGGGKKGGNNFSAPSFGFNPMDASFNPMAGMNPGAMQQPGFQPNQPNQPMNNGPSRVCNKYTGIIPKELEQFNTPQYGIPVFFKNHRLLAMLKDDGAGNQEVLVLAGCDSKEGPLRVTTPEDWNMIKISNLNFTGPYVINYDTNQQGQPGPSQQPAPWNPQGQQQPGPSQQPAPWNPQGQQQPGPSQQPAPWNPQGQQQQQPGPQPAPWNPQQQQQPGPQQQPAPWNPQGQQQPQGQPGPQTIQWNPPQSTPQPQPQPGSWNTQPNPQQHPQQPNPQQHPQQPNPQQHPQQPNPQQPPQQPQPGPWNTQPQPTPQQPPQQPQPGSWNMQPPQQTPPQQTPPQPIENVIPQVAVSTESSPSFDSIVSGITASSPKTNTPAVNTPIVNTPNGVDMQVHQF